MEKEKEKDKEEGNSKWSIFSFLCLIPPVTYYFMYPIMQYIVYEGFKMNYREGGFFLISLPLAIVQLVGIAISVVAIIQADNKKLRGKTAAVIALGLCMYQILEGVMQFIVYILNMLN